MRTRRTDAEAGTGLGIGCFACGAHVGARVVIEDNSVPGVPLHRVKCLGCGSVGPAGDAPELAVRRWERILERCDPATERVHRQLDTLKEDFALVCELFYHPAQKAAPTAARKCICGLPLKHLIHKQQKGEEGEQ